jgi:7-cyano-7-deazaguanine synthase
MTGASNASKDKHLCFKNKMTKISKVTTSQVRHKQLNIQKKCLVLLSGGIDSTTLAFWLKKQGYGIECLYFDYGQGQTNGERECAVSIARQLGANLNVLVTPRPRESLRNIISSHSNNAELFGDVVNMCTMAATFAFILGMDSILLGVNANDVRVHPALQTRFFRTIEKLVTLWTGNKLKVLTPFLDKDKSSVIAIGAKLGVPFENTWSCSVNVDKHCGRCSDCLARKQAFREAGLPDRTEYEHEI